MPGRYLTRRITKPMFSLVTDGFRLAHFCFDQSSSLTSASTATACCCCRPRQNDAHDTTTPYLALPVLFFEHLLFLIIIDQPYDNRSGERRHIIIRRQESAQIICT